MFFIYCCKSFKIRIKMEWININDRLPNDSDDVLVWGEGYCVGLAWYWDEDGNTKQGFYMEECGYDGGEMELKEWVTHWMPKPLPPK